MAPKSQANKPKGGKPKSPPKEQPFAIKAYLIAFNLVSFFGWVLILSTLLKHIAAGPQTPSKPIELSAKLLARFRPLRVFLTSTYPNVPEPIGEALRRSSQLLMHVGPLVAAVQSLAILEVVHSAFGWVRSPVPTTAIQVASRLFMVWAVSERYDQASGSAWYASMVLAWSITESVRYPFYANALMGSESDSLLWARYTLFYVLYPLGAGSEAMLIATTLPKYWPWQGSWTPRELVYGFLFVIWWPGLYVMYTHMMKQRKRAIGKGFWGDKLQQKKVDEKTKAFQEVGKKIR
ncbi:unnamed protein product [Sympodiomycopsis kandeliae]